MDGRTDTFTGLLKLRGRTSRRPRAEWQQFTSQFGEKLTEATGPILPLENYPEDATALQVLGGGKLEPIAEPVRLGGSAPVIHSSR